MHASESFICLSPRPYDLRPKSPCVDQFKDVGDHHLSYPHVVCSFCKSFDHDVFLVPIMMYSVKHMLDLMP